MKRRAFVAGLGWSLIALKFGLLAGCGNGRETGLEIAADADGARQALADYLAGLDGIEHVGPDCLLKSGSKEPLEDLLSGLRATGRSGLGQALETAISGDFQADRIVELEGWQLSATECLLIAAAASVQGMASPLAEIDPGVELKEFVDIADWGPRETRENQVFNRQPGDRGAFWIRTEGPVPDGVKLLVGSEALAVNVAGDRMTAIVDAEVTERLIAEPGLQRLFLVDEAGQRIQPVGQFRVRAAAPRATLEDGSRSRVFCEVEQWGPESAPAGTAFNEQPDGSAAFWVRIGCAPPTARLLLDGTALPTSVGDDVVTARVVHFADLDAGERALVLEDPETGERLPVGRFRSN